LNKQIHKIKINIARIKNKKAPGDYELTIHMRKVIGSIGMHEEYLVIKCDTKLIEIGRDSTNIYERTPENLPL
jgi:hypothetical protein